MTDMDLVDLCTVNDKDCKELLDLWRRAGLPVRASGRDAPEAIARQLASGAQRVLGLRAGGVLVAAAVLTHDGRKGWINRLAVDPAHRRRGLAQALVAEAERWFVQDLGLEVWAVLVEEENVASQGLFEHLGFQRHSLVYMSKRLRSDA